jgi:hypothetical protein
LLLRVLPVSCHYSSILDSYPSSGKMTFTRVLFWSALGNHDSLWAKAYDKISFWLPEIISTIYVWHAILILVNNISKAADYNLDLCCNDFQKSLFISYHCSPLQQYVPGLSICFWFILVI